MPVTLAAPAKVTVLMPAAALSRVFCTSFRVALTSLPSTMLSTELKPAPLIFVPVLSTTRLSLPAPRTMELVTELNAPVCTTSSPVPPNTPWLAAPKVKLLLPSASV